MTPLPPRLTVNPIKGLFVNKNTRAPGRTAEWRTTMTTRKISGKRSYTILHWQILGSCQIIIKVFFLVRQSTVVKGLSSFRGICLPTAQLLTCCSVYRCRMSPPFQGSPTFIVNLDQDQNAIVLRSPHTIYLPKDSEILFFIIKLLANIFINSIQFNTLTNIRVLVQV